MSDILPLTIGVLPTHNHYGLRNTQALAGVSHVWQDFFARALAEQLGETPDAPAAHATAPLDPAVEPSAGADLLSQILTQRECDVKDTEIAPQNRCSCPSPNLKPSCCHRLRRRFLKKKSSPSNVSRISKAVGYALSYWPPGSHCRSQALRRNRAPCTCQSPSSNWTCCHRRLRLTPKKRWWSSKKPWTSTTTGRAH